MAVEPIPCQTGGGGTPVEVTTCCSPSIASTALCRPDGTTVLLVVQSGCVECGQDAPAPEVVGWVDTATGTYTPGAPPADAGACETIGGCEEPTQPVAMTGLCLADGTPISVVVTRDCAGTVTQEGWLNLTTGAWAAGAPPAGTIACGNPRSIQVSGTFCDVDPNGDVVGLVLIEYSYAPDGSIAGVRLVDAVTGGTYTPQGEVTTCPAGVEQPERDLVQLCDLTDAESGAGLLPVPFLRDYQRDETGQITGHTDYTLDGAPYVPTGTVGVCPQESTCRDCTTQVLCDVPASTVTAPILNPPQPPAGARSGTLPNGVGWEVYGGSSSVPNWWSIALLPSPSAGPLPVRFTQPVTAEWSAQVGRRGVGVGIIVMPPGTQLVSLDPAHLWDPATRVFRPDPASGPVGAGAPTSRFRHTGPVTELLFATDGSTGFSATQRMVGDFLVTPATQTFLRTVCRDCDGQVLDTTDTLLDGATPYEPVGTVGVCHPPETEPCASTVEVLRLCDLNPTVEPDEQGRRCAVPFLRHLVHDCSGALVETRDTGVDGATPYTPVQVVDCTAGVPALAELLWPQTGIAEDPAGLARQDFIYTITNPQTGDVAEVRLHASSTSPGGCGPYDPANPVFNNPTTYTLTLDSAAQEMSTFRLDLIDFDTFEGITGLSPVPSRVEGDVTWSGSTITANQSNAAAAVYWDNPPATISYRYGNTGGGLACSAVAFQGMTLVPEGCCGCDAAEPCRDTSSTLLCDTTTTEAVTVFDPAGAADADGWEVVSFTGAQPGYGPTGPMPYPVYRGTSNTGQISYGARPDLNAGPAAMPWPGYDKAPIRWIIRKTFEAPQDGTATVTATGFRADGGGRVRINGVDMGLYSQWGQPGVGGGGQAPVTAGPNLVEIEVRDDWGYNWATGKLDIVMTKTVEFLRRTVVDCETGETVSITDTTLDGQPYEVTGEVGTCTPVEECCPQQNTETIQLCDTAADGTVTPFLRHLTHAEGGAITAVVDTLLDGATTYTPAGTVGVCDQAEPCRDTSSTLLCDTSATDLITVFDPANRPSADGWEVVSFTGYRADAPPEAPLPYPARYGTVIGYPALGARTDQSAGYGGGNWAGYDNAPVRWVLRKTFTAPEDGVAIAQSVGFRGDGGARVRINGIDAGMYGQWNQPATSGTAQIPVTAGANVVEIEVRDVGGINNVVGRLDIALPRTVQFMRRQVTDCVTGEVIATHDTTLDGDPYTVTGEVGECRPVAECCEQAPPETRVDVETQLLCVRDTATGEVLDQVLVERVYDDQTGDLISQRITDPTTTEPVTLPAGAELARCPSPDRITRQICVAASGAAEFLTNAANATSGQDTDWTWSPSPTGPWHPMYRVAPNPVWTATDTAPNPAHWVSPHADRTVCPTAGETSPMLPGTWYTRASWMLPVDVDPATIRISASILNADNKVVQWRLNDGAWQPVAGGTLGNPPWTFPPTAVPGGRAGQNEVVVQLQETNPPTACPNTNQAGMILHVAATYDHEPRTWTQVLEDGRVYYLDENGARQDALLPGDRIVSCGGGAGGECCPVQDAEVLQLCDLAAGQAPVPFLRHLTYTDGATPPVIVDTTLDGDPYTLVGEAGTCPECPTSFATECVGVVERTEASYDNTSLIGGLPGLCGGVQGPDGQFPCTAPDNTPFTIVSWIVNGEEVIGEGSGRQFNGGACGPGTDAAPGMHRTWAEALTNLDPTGATWAAEFADSCAWYVGSTGGTGTTYGPMAIVGTSYSGVTESRWVLGPAQGCAETQYTKVYTQECDGTVSVRWLDADGAETTPPAGERVPCGTGCTGTSGAECDAHYVEECRWDDTDGDGIGDVQYVEIIKVDGCTGALTTVGTYTADLTGPYTPVAPVDDGTSTPPTSTGVQAHRVEVAAGASWSVADVPLLQAVTMTAHGGTATITTETGDSTLYDAESVSWSVGRDDDAALVGPLTVTAGTGTVTVAYTRTVTL
ncbi:hypothetical protein ACFV1C_00015 [Streptomyces sp. NPDC059605]|uniref:hypothetical protein n=1 Tax=Streptomyces sp. NPDC059605 TaxID=3346882 RepID=UPI0036892125